MLFSFLRQCCFYGSRKFEVVHESGLTVDLFVDWTGLRLAQGTSLLLFFALGEILTWTFTAHNVRHSGDPPYPPLPPI